MEKKNKKVVIILLASLLTLSHSLYAFSFWKAKEEKKDLPLNGKENKVERDEVRNPSLSREGQGQDTKYGEKSLTIEKSHPCQGGVLQVVQGVNGTVKCVSKKENSAPSPIVKMAYPMPRVEFIKKEVKPKNQVTTSNSRMEPVASPKTGCVKMIAAEAREMKVAPITKEENVEKKSNEQKENAISADKPKAKVQVKPAIMKENEEKEKEAPQPRTDPREKNNPPTKVEESASTIQRAETKKPVESKPITPPSTELLHQFSSNGAVKTQTESASESKKINETVHVPPVPDILTSPVPAPQPKKVTTVEIPATSCQPIILLLSVDTVFSVASEIAKKEPIAVENHTSEIKPIVIPIQIQLKSSGEAEIKSLTP